MDAASKTLYIPLWAKALVSQRDIILSDPTAEKVWASEGFPLGRRSRSKWLAYYLGMRAAVFDGWVRDELARSPESCVLHVGCGLDSRALRVAAHGGGWYDVDLPEVIEERRRHCAESDGYHMLPGDLCMPSWLESVPGERAIVVMEGVSMYLSPDDLRGFLKALSSRFSGVRLLADCYSALAAHLSRLRNPVSEMGVSEVHGVNDPRELEAGTGLAFVREHDITPRSLIAELSGPERVWFSLLYGGPAARRLYRLYEYASGSAPSDVEKGLSLFHTTRGA